MKGGEIVLPKRVHFHHGYYCPSPARVKLAANIGVSKKGYRHDFNLGVR
jgi:hypothetical protein